MLKSCKYCGRVHDHKHDCGMKPKPQTKTRTDAVKYRSSAAWQRKRLEALERDMHSCRVCQLGEYGTADGRKYYTKELAVHHIIPVTKNFELRDDIDNLITLCPMHHEMAHKNKIGTLLLQNLAKSTPLRVLTEFLEMP